MSRNDPLPRKIIGKVRPRIFACGDCLDTASINGTMATGRRTAKAVLAELSA